MTRAVAVAVIGVLLIALGLVMSPWPWLAAVVPGALLLAAGSAVLFRMEVDE